MRYRRYYTRVNRDGSKTVTSVGPVAETAGLGARALLWFLFVVVVLGLPWSITDAIRNGWGMALAIVAAILWYSLVAVLAWEEVKKRGAELKKGTQGPRRW